MIKAVIVMNDQGKPRLVKFYSFQAVEKQHELIRSIYGVLCSRANNVSNFIKVDSLFGPDARLVYKTFATLYFIFVFDSSENELAILDLMQGSPEVRRLIRKSVFCAVDLHKLLLYIALRDKFFVETLDKCFHNVCELDIIFNFNKVHSILDEIILGGQVLETNSSEVAKAAEEISKMEKHANSVTLVPSISGWSNR